MIPRLKEMLLCGNKVTVNCVTKRALPLGTSLKLIDLFVIINKLWDRDWTLGKEELLFFS